MNFKLKYVIPSKQEDKYRLMNFVYNNTESFVMNTFGYLWETRRWWEQFPVLIACYEQTDIIVGLHAFTCNTKAEKTLKTYYIVTDKKYKGKGIGKMLTQAALGDSELWCDKFYVNSNSIKGIGFYKKLIGEPKSVKYNEFGNQDCEFECNFKHILK